MKIHWIFRLTAQLQYILSCRTFSIRILSPMVGAQYPSSTIISPAVTLYCLPITWMTAKRRPSACWFTNWFTLFIIDWHVFCSTIGDLMNSSVFGFWRNVFRGINDGSAKRDSVYFCKQNFKRLCLFTKRRKGIFHLKFKV